MKVLHTRLVHLTARASNGLGTSSIVAKKAKRARDMVGDLRSALDSAAFRDYPDKDHFTLTGAYYGEGRSKA